MYNFVIGLSADPLVGLTTRAAVLKQLLFIVLI